MDIGSAFSPANWPVFFLCFALIVAAVIDFWKLKVPNWLTFPLIFTGWGFAIINGWATGGTFGDGMTALWAAFVLTWFGLVLLLPVYAIGGMGAGDVKMQMGFGSWVGAIYGLNDGFWIVLLGFCLAAVIGGVIALGMMVCRGDFRGNRQNAKEIITDLYQSSSVYEVSDKARQRKPRLHLLPYGVPLCIGFISYLALRSLQLFQ